MKAALSLEYIGEAYEARVVLMARVLDEAAAGLGRCLVGPARPRKPWVAEITGRDVRYGLRRRFLPANWQRLRANGAHTRGVELWFTLESGRLYEVKEPVSWRRTDRWFCTVDDAGSIVRLGDTEVETWLSSRSASMS